jgi:hypothetical protein
VDLIEVFGPLLTQHKFSEPPMAYLKVSGTKIVDKDDKEIILRGAGLGGWMK